MGMLVPEDSPLRRLPAALDERQRLFIDGMRYAIDSAGIAFDGLRAALVELSGENPASHSHERAVMYAWSMVDSVNRLRVLTDQFPKLKKRDPKAQSSLRRMAPYEDLRNPIQRLAQECNRLVQNG